MRALSRVILDRQVMYIRSAEGTAVILPLEHYIRLAEMESTVHRVLARARDGDVQGIVDTVECMAQWLLEGGSEHHYIIGEGGDVRTL